MEFLQRALEVFLGFCRAVWPGVLGAAGGGYIGWTMLGFPGFLIGAALGALVGTWAGNRLGLVPVRKMTGSANNDQLIYATGAFVLVVVGYLLVQVAMIIGAIVAIAVLVMFWLQS